MNAAHPALRPHFSSVQLSAFRCNAGNPHARHRPWLPLPPWPSRCAALMAGSRHATSSVAYRWNRVSVPTVRVPRSAHLSSSRHTSEGVLKNHPRPNPAPQRQLPLRASLTAGKGARRRYGHERDSAVGHHGGAVGAPLSPCTRVQPRFTGNSEGDRG